MIGKDGLYCDVCGEKLTGYYVHLPARFIHCEVWGWYEGHMKCLIYMEKSKDIVYGEAELIEAS